MLEIVIQDQDLFHPSDNTFVPVKGITLQLEHSLVSLKEWERRWKVPFLGKRDKTMEQFDDYIRCMTLNPDKDLDPNIYRCLTPQMKQDIIKYLATINTATWISDPFGEKKGRGSGIVTAEIIYYWMIALNIPMEFQNWNLNELLILIQVVNEKQQPKKKMSHQQWAQRARDINAARRAMLNTNG